MTTNLLKGKLTKERLQELYWERGLNTRQIGEMFGVSAVAIQYHLRKHEIPKRDIVECHKGIGVGHPCYYDSTGIPRTEETRAKISEALKGKPSPMRGRRGWSHGLTKETHPSLARMVLRGEQNHNFGRFKGEDNPHFGKSHSEEAKRRIGDAQRGPLNHAYGKTLTAEHKELLRQRSLELAQNPEYIAKLSAATKRLWEDPKFRAAREEERRQMWRNPEHVAKVMKSLHARPTKPEQELIELLAEIAPQFKYNGDFSQGVTLCGLIPDFVNTDGKKEIIECFGAAFHDPEVAFIKMSWHQTELGRIMAYNSLGYRTLIIWDRDLRDKEAVRHAIRQFVSRR